VRVRKTLTITRLSVAAAAAMAVVLTGISPASASVGETSSATTAASGASDVAAASTTDGTQSATHGTPAAGSLSGCTTGYHMEICFEKYGDKIWVNNEDLLSSEYGHYSNWLRDSSGAWTFWRNGNCIVDYNGWGYCNKDFYEDSSYNVVGGQGSGVRLYPCDVEFGCTSSLYGWVRNNG
jgi:hypothetical protein